jgi:peroxiredoxin family protein
MWVEAIGVDIACSVCQVKSLAILKTSPETLQSATKALMLIQVQETVLNPTYIFHTFTALIKP